MKGKNNTPLSEEMIKIMENDKRERPAGKLESKFFTEEQLDEISLENIKSINENGFDNVDLDDPDREIK